jgi:hypothetical protein
MGNPRATGARITALVSGFVAITIMLSACASEPVAAPTTSSATTSPSPTPEPEGLAAYTAPEAHWQGVDCLTLFGDAAARFGPMTTGDTRPSFDAQSAVDDPGADTAASAQAGYLRCLSVGSGQDNQGIEVGIEIVPGGAEVGAELLAETIGGEIRTSDDSVLGCSMFTATSYFCSGNFLVDGDFVTLRYRGYQAEPDVYAVADELIDAAYATLATLPQTEWEQPSTAWTLPETCEAVDPDGTAALAGGLPSQPSAAIPAGYSTAERIVQRGQRMLYCSEADTAEWSSGLWFTILPGAAWVEGLPIDGTRITRHEDAEIDGAIAARWTEISSYGNEKPPAPVEVLDIFTDGGWILVSGSSNEVPLDRAALAAAGEALLARIEG